MTRSVHRVLKELGLKHHEKAFKENSIDSLDDLSLLTNDDLKDLGVTKIGERNRLTAWIKQHSESQPPTPPSESPENNEDTSPLPERSRSTNPFEDEKETEKPLSLHSTSRSASTATNPFDDDEGGNDSNGEGRGRPVSMQSIHSTNPFDSDDDELDDLDNSNGLISPEKAENNHTRSPTKDDEDLLRELEKINEENQKNAIRDSRPPAPAISKEEVQDDHSEEEEDDLAVALDDMNIDQDFACWKSFRSSISSRNLSVTSSSTADKNASADTIQEQNDEQSPEEIAEADIQDLKNWNARLNRDEVYSHRYRPVPREERELDDLATFLGIQKPKSKRKLQETSRKQLPDDENGILSYLFSKDERPFSVLLKRGPVLFKQEDSSKATFEERELILLTHGFILARVNDNNKRNPISGLIKWVQRSFDQCHLYTNVKCLRDTPSNDGFEIHLVDGNILQFECATATHQLAWLDGLERVIVETYTRFSSDNHVRTDDESDLGWQHKLVQTSLYSDAVMGDANSLEERLTTLIDSVPTINRLDKYHEFAALHYATHHNHLDCMRVLLEAGADPSIENGVKDMDDMFQSPLYFAKRDGWQEGIDLLVQFGAKPSRRAAMEDLGGELFSNARVVEEKVTSKRNHKNERTNQTHSRATNAKGAMSENMRLIHERGQKIEDLGTKANKLQSGAGDYASYAKQLREKTKKQSRWGF